jgi:EAL domain-containing protein (putative c-di-GMP-specific phosphodiesterase class I)/GGDEF domain-containing protein
MTLTRRMALFIAGILLLALGGALVIHTLGARQALQQQQDMRNRDAAAALALALSQQGGDLAAMQAVAAAQFDLGHYRRITLLGPDGQRRIALAQAESASRAPAWFVALLPLQVGEGKALVSSGWVELGTLTVEAHTTWAQEALWRASARTAGLLAGLAVLALALSAWMLRAWQRPLLATVAQAQALEQGRFVQAELPTLPELQQLTRSMNATVRRLREMFAHQAEQVAYLQRRAQLDLLTGLPMRRHFLQAVDRRLAQRDGLGLSLVLVRVAQLEQINLTQGHEAADTVLRQVAAVLARHSQAEPDFLAGRLTGSDFALCLPVPGMAAEMAPALWRALKAAAPADSGAQVFMAALEGQTGANAEAVLAQAAWAMARAEAGSGLQVEPLRPGAVAVASLAAWQAQIRAALAEDRVQLGEFAVQDAQGGLIHLECPLRLQLDPEGRYQPAARWLAMARRCGVMPLVDLAALRHALQACAADGRPRAVNVALASLSAPGLVAAVAAQLQAVPAASRLLSIEWVDGGGRGDWQAAEQAITAWQGLGVRMGVEHAGAAPEQLARLRDLGVHYVKVDGLHLRGAASDPAVGAYARSLVGLIQLLGLQAVAEGVDHADDLAALWQLGFDGATGRAVGAAAPVPTLPPATGGQPARPHASMA